MSKISNYTYTRKGNKYTPDSPKCPLKRFISNHFNTLLVCIGFCGILVAMHTNTL
jgi:hypothetical protein